jgi:hypothetical protein
MHGMLGQYPAGGCLNRSDCTGKYSTRGAHMYIGIGALVVVVMLVLILT